MRFLRGQKAEREDITFQNEDISEELRIYKLNYKIKEFKENCELLHRITSEVIPLQVFKEGYWTLKEKMQLTIGTRGRFP